MTLPTVRKSSCTCIVYRIVTCVSGNEGAEQLLSLVFEISEVFRVATLLVANNIEHRRQINGN